MFRLSSSFTHDPAALQRGMTVHDDGRNLQFDPDSVSLETCFALSRPQDDDENLRTHCNLVLTQCGDPGSRRTRRNISRIVMVSSFRRAEAHRVDSGEYVATFKARLLEDSEPDMEMWLADMDVKGLELKSVELRFPSPPDSIWVMSFQVGLDEETSLPSSSGKFNLNRLDSMLGGSELSDKAKDFKKLFTDFQHGAAVFPGLSLMSLGANMPSPPVNSDGAVTASTCKGDSSAQKSDSNSGLDAVITKRDLEELESRLNARLAAFALDQNAKLNRIINLLEKSNNISSS